MSKASITRYYAELEKLKKLETAQNESSLREAFKSLLKETAENKGFYLIAETSGDSEERIRPDATIKNFGLEFGHWEAKDPKDNLEREILKKINKGYPLKNIIFEDTRLAVLYQDGKRVKDYRLANETELESLLKDFFAYKHPAINDFKRALEKFKSTLPEILKALRLRINESEKKDNIFIQKRHHFLKFCQESIHSEISLNDVNEMLIQHLLTYEVFSSVFNKYSLPNNNIFKLLEELDGIFLPQNERINLFSSLEEYYIKIVHRAREMKDRCEKQKFLKLFYETFYKAYNPKGADRLGIVYTPNEAVRFILHATDELLERHFDKSLSEEQVQILDPCTGTGTFICELLEYIRPSKLRYKFLNEIHANEISLLPYYIALLNIEDAYQQRANEYASYPHLCFLDTLDNTAALNFEGKANRLFAIGEENIRRIQNQNKQDLFIIIGNPPYNARQKNANHNNQNRLYPTLDKRIKQFYVQTSSAQKTNCYDPYVRFIRWATDRIGAKGIVAYITNRSFIDASSFDGFRQTVEKEFDYAYIVDLGGDIRGGDTSGNIFGIQTGVAISIWVKCEHDKNEKCKIFYYNLALYEKKSENKLAWLNTAQFNKIDFERIRPDAQHHWLGNTINDWENLVPLAHKEAKLHNASNSVFKIYYKGNATGRDEWVYDLDKNNLMHKLQYFKEIYDKHLENENNNKNTIDYDIKWSRDLLNKLKAGKKITIRSENIQTVVYRPFFKKFFFYNQVLSDVLTKYQLAVGGRSHQNANWVIHTTGKSAKMPYQCFATNLASDYGLLEKTISFPLYQFDNEDNPQDNITDWALDLFRKRYGDERISKRSIFDYVYGVMHNPTYRAKYAVNLKRELPRIPFYEDFWRFAAWGNALINLHVNYETVEPYPLTPVNLPSSNASVITPILRADKTANVIFLDTQTSLTGIPTEAWDYQLGRRSALEWILDQYKEKEYEFPILNQRFNTYRFADYKEQVIDLLTRVCRVSVETVRIMREMANLQD